MQRKFVVTGRGGFRFEGGSHEGNHDASHANDHSFGCCESSVTNHSETMPSYTFLRLDSVDRLLIYFLNKYGCLKYFKGLSSSKEQIDCGLRLMESDLNMKNIMIGIKNARDREKEHLTELMVK